MSEPVRFIHLTDLHVGDPAVRDEHLYSDTNATLAAILADVKKLVPAPRFVVVSGDLTNRGDAGSYEMLKSIFAEADLAMPVLFALGNHDRRDGFYQVMLGKTDHDDTPYDHSCVIDGIHVVVLDSSLPGKVGGGFEPGQIDWLKAELEHHADLPKLLVMHHAPTLDADPATEWEALSISDTEVLRQTVAGKNILGILSGHVHYDRVSNWYGVPVVIGIGQHGPTDVQWLHEGIRMLEGASFVIGAARPSGLTVTFAPLRKEVRELSRSTHVEMVELIKSFETGQQAAE